MDDSGGVLDQGKRRGKNDRGQFGQRPGQVQRERQPLPDEEPSERPDPGFSDNE